MRQRLHTLVQFALAVFVATSLFAANAVVPTGKAVEGEVLVKVRESASTADVNSVEKAGDVDKSEKLSHLKTGALYRMHSRSKNTDALTTALAKNPNIEYVEPNYIVQATASPNDPSYGLLWGLKNTGQSIQGTTGTAGVDIGAEAAWTVTTGSTSVVVGVVDTGIDYTHPDLAANIWSNPGGKGNAGCNAGTHGFNAITKTCDPKDDYFHGTHVTGTIGAVGNNSIGVAGVNHVASIMGLKFLNSNGSGTTADAITAIDFAVQAKLDGVNLRILSNSWGGGAFSKALLDEINKAGENDILFVASAGNSGYSNDTSPSYPASYGAPNIISVAATDNRDNLAYFSNYGPTTVHLGAPGVAVYSTMPNNSYGYLDGTSMAAPHVSGVAALVLAHTPGLTTAQVKSAILDNTDPIPSLTGRTITGGRLNAARALGLPAPADFKLTVTPSVQSVVPGGSVAYGVNIAPLNGFSGSVALSVANLPAGAIATFNPASATTSSVLTVTTSNTTPLSSYLLTLTGVSGSTTRTAQATVTVTSTPQVTACPSFSSPSYYYPVSAPIAVALADLNRDGRPDIITASTSNKIIVVPSASGSGNSYGSIGSYTTANGTIAVATGDFNGDGKIDVVSANSGGGNVSVLLGNGDGTLQPAVNYAAGASPFAVATGDFNRDGKLDLAVANNGAGNVSILLGNGDGTFQAAINSAAASGPYFIATGDFDGDGKLDLAVAAYNAGKVVILLGNGDGTFAAPAGYSTATGPSGVAAGDLNGDGKLDLAVTNYGSGNVSVLLGNGNGTFGSAANYGTANGPTSVGIADFDGDGKADLAVSNTDSGNVSLLLGTGIGTFLTTTNYGLDPVLNQLAVADLNNDGKPDVVAISTYYSELSFLYNNSFCKVNCGVLGTAADQPADSTPMAAVAGDFNRDGKVDFAVANSGSNNVSIKSGNGDGTFQAAVNFGAGTNPGAIVAGDFNRDGKLDVATANDGSGNVSVLPGNGDGTFAAAIDSTAGTNPRSIASGDFNRDGKLDVAVADYGSNDVTVLLGNGDGTFQAPVPYTAGTNPSAVAAGDFNRDGILDLAVANAGSANVSIFIGNSNGTFQAATNITAGTTPYSIVVADLNGDTKLDLAVANSGSSNISVFLGNGSGTFQSATSYGTGTNPHGITAADFNGDGKLDLAVANNGMTNASLLFGDGAGGFGAAVTYGAGLAPAGVFSADFNRDGKSDLGVVNSGGSGSISILLDNCLPADLAVAVSHSGTFAQASSGNNYTISVSNIGTGQTSGVVSVTDTLPPSMTATAMSGSGWTCTPAGRTCTRTDAMGAGGTYPPITLTVSVSGTAPTSVTNSATVYGGGEITTNNDTGTDPTTITGSTDLIVTSSHAGSFTRGDTARSYQLTVINIGALATDGSTVTVTDTLPAGLIGTGMSGTGWSCSGGLSCTRSDSLAGGASYPPITVTLNVASNAGSPLVNVATVSGGGEINASNDTASDPTVVWAPQSCTGLGAGISFPTTYSQGDLTVADFNGDGRPDIASVINSYTGSVSVLIATGNNAFASAVFYPVGAYPVAIVATDLNKDGKIDLVVANSYAYSNNTVGLSVLLGNGNGTFAPAVNYPTPTYPRHLTVADFNGDGYPDVAVALGSSQAAILLGNGDGTLRTAFTTPVGGSGYAIANADFNGDGKVDLVLTRDSVGVGLLLGNGDGSFQSPVTIGTSYVSYGLGVADFNHDGKPDIVAFGYFGPMYVFLGNGDGTFQIVSTAFNGYSGRSSVVDDINGDGKPDIMLVGNSYFTTMMGNGDNVGPPTNLYLSAYSVAVSDFNGDGRPDYALSFYNSVSIYTGACTDLSITKTHYGNFIGGQTGSYTISVSNSGGSWAGTVTVTDNLPSPLTVASMYGNGWTCNTQTVTCTRSDSVAGGSSYPQISLVVNVPLTQTASVVNTATVSGGGDTNGNNNMASDPTNIVQAPDLIVINHSGNFAQGQSGKTYTITVANNGGAPTSGNVTVTGSVPSSLTATSLSGSGWNCTTLGSLTCVRSDALAVTSSYPPITLTVSVSNTAPANVTSNASVNGGGETNTGNNYASDQATVITTPLNVNAVAVSGTQVSLSWDPVLYSTSYQVFRSASINAPFVLIGSPLSNSFVDATAAANTTYLYKVAATDGTNTGPLSLLDMATTYFYSDDPIVVRSTRVKASHIGELRQAVNIVRAAAGLGAASYTDPTLNPGMYIKAVHFSQLRAALDAARAALGLTATVYTDPSLTSGVTIKAAHIRDLRTATK